MRLGEPIINFFPIEFETGWKGTAKLSQTFEGALLPHSLQ
jgi:hypothetical protein